VNIHPTASAEAARVLVVDDDPAVRSALSFAFGVDGFDVESFDSAESLLEAGVAEADCLVVDYRLPGRDGLELVDQLRREGSRTPAVLITSQPRAAVKARADAMNIYVVEKPLLSDDLIETIRGIVGRHALASDHRR